jgi:hypothetical protein
MKSLNGFKLPSVEMSTIISLARDINLAANGLLRAAIDEIP